MCGPNRAIHQTRREVAGADREGTCGRTRGGGDRRILAHPDNQGTTDATSMNNPENLVNKIDPKSYRGSFGGALPPPGVPKGSQRGIWQRKVGSLDPSLGSLMGVIVGVFSRGKHFFHNEFWESLE